MTVSVSVNSNGKRSWQNRNIYAFKEGQDTSYASTGLWHKSLWPNEYISRLALPSYSNRRLWAYCFSSKNNLRSSLKGHFVTFRYCLSRSSCRAFGENFYIAVFLNTFQESQEYDMDC